MNLAKIWLTMSFALFLASTTREMVIRWPQRTPALIATVGETTPVLEPLFQLGSISVGDSRDGIIWASLWSHDQLGRITGSNASYVLTKGPRFREMASPLGAPCYLPSKKLIIVADSWKNQLLVFDENMRLAGRPIPTGDYPAEVVPAADGASVWVLTFFGSSLTHVSIPDGRIVESIAVPRFSRSLRIDPLTQNFILAVSPRNQIWIVHPGSSQTIEKLQADSHPMAIVVSPRGNEFFTISAQTRNLRTYGKTSLGDSADVSWRQRMILLPEPPNDVAFFDGWVWISLAWSHQVIAVDPTSLKILKRVSCQTMPGPFVATPETLFVQGRPNGELYDVATAAR